MSKTKVAPCPECGGEVRVTDCGYTAFNVGSAECLSCGSKVKLSMPDDREDAIRMWNVYAKSKSDEALQNELTKRLRKRESLRKKRLKKEKKS